MSASNNNTSSTRTTTGRAHYKVTKTVTGPDGKTHTETVEMHDDDAVKVSLLYGNRCYYACHFLIFNYSSCEIYEAIVMMYLISIDLDFVHYRIQRIFHR